MSYVRFDDRHDDGRLTQFRERLGAEVRAQTGEEFAIFQDRNDIAWGQNWQARIDEALDAVTLLLVVVTPSLFRSPACRAEVSRFLEREEKLGRQDLILPVYYISAREMDDPLLRDADDLARVLSTRQHADWRELRFEPFTSPVVLRATAQLASRMRDTFWHPGAVAPVRRVAGHAKTVGPAIESTEPAGTTSRGMTKTEPPTHVVDPYHRGDFITVGAAIKAAKPGDRILVRPGLYEESLVVDKPLEILGDGPLEDIEIRARDANVLVFQAGIGRVANLTVRQMRGKWFAVFITQGRLELEGCDISGGSLSAVSISGGADPRLRRNRIHGSGQSGVLVHDGGLGTLEDNEITGNGYSGVAIADAGDPTLRRNRIYDNKQCGVYVRDGGLGTVEDNEITGNGYTGVAIKKSGSPSVRRNRIYDNKESGVFVYERGLGTLEDNAITGNGGAGMLISERGSPTVRNNRINGNGYEAVWVKQGGGGVFEDNDLTGNARGPWDIAKNCEANVTRNRNQE